MWSCICIGKEAFVQFSRERQRDRETQRETERQKEGQTLKQRKIRNKSS